jgi:hypothetical protein
MLVAQKESLTENQCRERDVHGIPDEAVETFDDEVTGGKDRGRCPDALQCETGEGFQDYGDASNYQEETDGTEGRETEERWAETPAGDPPGDESSNGSGREDEKSCCSQDGG